MEKERIEMRNGTEDEGTFALKFSSLMGVIYKWIWSNTWHTLFQFESDLMTKNTTRLNKSIKVGVSFASVQICNKYKIGHRYIGKLFSNPHTLSSISMKYLSHTNELCKISENKCDLQR